MPVPRRIGPVSRVIAGVLAVIWIGAGSFAIGLGVPRHDWRAAALGALALGIGIAWAAVARLGRYLTGTFARFRK